MTGCLGPAGGPAAPEAAVLDTAQAGLLGDGTYTTTYQPAAAGCPSGEWKASYFANQPLSGTPVTKQCQSAIACDWGYSRPSGANVGPDDFSVHWVRQQSYTAGTYTFTVTADDGVRVYLDGALVIDQWKA